MKNILKLTLRRRKIIENNAFTGISALINPNDLEISL